MDGLREYLLSVTVAAVVCGILARFLSGKGTATAIGKMMAGIFMATVVIGPFAKLEIGEFDDFTSSFQAEASKAVSDGQANANSALADIIKQRTEAYILDKARSFHVELTVQVELSRAALPVPESVRLQGSASPYAKGQLQALIENDLGIPREKQIWT